MRFVVYQDLAHQWRWRLIAANNRIIADSAEGYWNKADCLHGVQLVKQSYNSPVYEQ
jgi:uncharacterized protein